MTSISINRCAEAIDPRRVKGLRIIAKGRIA